MHKSGQGCPRCSGNVKLNVQDVILDFKRIHGDKYDYSKVIYKNNNSKVTIICPKHGEFLQTPESHKLGSNCPKCIGKQLSLPELISQFQKVHGHKYDYSQVEYKDTHSKIKIICAIHGKFKQSSSSHKNGQGCPKCSGKKLTNVDVIEEFKKIHGNKYDYSKVKYTNAITSVKIGCSEHGFFLQTPNSHKSGYGCPKCGGKIRLTTREIIKEFEKVHGNRYDYSKVDYRNTDTKVVIICRLHGDFQQSPSSHKQGSGCPYCIKNAKLTSFEVIQEFKRVHGDKYDYSKVKFKNVDSKVIIICKEHGEFLQTPYSHKKGVACPKCGGSFKLTTNEILAEFRKVHGDKYDYSKVDYKNTNSKVIIICNTHGEFLQSPSKHKSGSGCPTCNLGWTKPKILEFLHSIENQDLLNMDAVELQMIINQGKLPETFRDLAFADEDNKENTLKALKERLEAEVESAEFEELGGKRNTRRRLGFR
jgi:protein-arginine kinase activator protein McsA